MSVEFKGFSQGEVDQIEVFFKIECDSCGTLLDILYQESNFAKVYHQARVYSKENPGHQLKITSADKKDLADRAGKFCRMKRISEF